MSAELLYGTPCAEEILRETEKEMRGKSATLYTVGFRRICSRGSGSR